LAQQDFTYKSTKNMGTQNNNLRLKCAIRPTKARQDGSKRILSMLKKEGNAPRNQREPPQKGKQSIMLSVWFTQLFGGFRIDLPLLDMRTLATWHCSEHVLLSYSRGSPARRDQRRYFLRSPLSRQRHYR
jgi:hypothetical protein